MGTAFISACVYRVLRVLEDRARGPDLDDPAQIHHADGVADALHHGHVVADEQIAEAQLGLQFHHQVQHLRLHRHVERRDRLVGDDQLGVERERAGDGDALALAARQLVRVARMKCAAAHPVEQHPTPGRASRRADMPCRSCASARRPGGTDHLRIERGERDPGRSSACAPRERAGRRRRAP
jgi:hypothetical protein